MEGDQFGSEFVKINPNSKYQRLSIEVQNLKYEYLNLAPYLFICLKIYIFFLQKSTKEQNVFRGILANGKHTVLRWRVWLLYAYAPEKNEYCIDRYTIEVKRQLDIE